MRNRLAAAWRVLRAGRRFALIALTLAALTTTFVFGGFRPIDDGFAGLRARLLQRAPTQTLAIVTIDAASLHAHNEWPWPRERYARAINNLRAAGATLIAFDVDFSAQSNAADDDALRRAIAADPGSIVLPTFIQRDGVLRNLPMAALSQDALLASVNIPIDRDGKVRHYLRGYQIDGDYRPSVAAMLADAPYGDVSAFDLDYGIRIGELDRISFEDVYNNRFDPALVRGKRVLIGATALELGDTFATPVSPTYPGVAIHALAYESIAQNRAFVHFNALVPALIAFLVLVTLWPNGRSLDVARVLVRHLSVAGAMMIAPIALQLVAPVTLDIAIVYAAQAICLALTIQGELARRKRTIIEQREARLRFEANHHPDTNLPNRRAAVRRLHDLLRAAPDGAIGVVAMEIARFQILRGAIGQASANDAVKNLAANIAACCGGEAVMHLHSGVLCVLISGATEEECRTKAQDGLAHVNTKVPLDNKEISLSIRAGMSFSRCAATSPEAILEQATRALDEALSQKKRRMTYDAATFPDPRLRLTMLSEMAEGIARGEFRLVYQPKASLRDGRIIGAEALMRWTHPEHGPISPGAFVLAAEETGAIEPLTRWAIQQAIADQLDLRALGLDAPIAVNISGGSISSGAFCDFAIDAVRTSGAKITFEITETAIIEDPLQAHMAIEDFRDAGIKIAIDDYGAGLSSLAYLKTIAADELKLDKSLIDGVTQSNRDRLIVKSTAELAHGLGMTVVAEGAETEMTVAALAALGCDVVQGYAIARPMAKGDLVDFAIAFARARPRAAAAG